MNRVRYDRLSVVVVGNETYFDAAWLSTDNVGGMALVCLVVAGAIWVVVVNPDSPLVAFGADILNFSRAA